MIGVTVNPKANPMFGHAKHWFRTLRLLEHLDICSNSFMHCDAPLKHIPWWILPWQVCAIKNMANVMIFREPNVLQSEQSYLRTLWRCCPWSSFLRIADVSASKRGKRLLYASQALQLSNSFNLACAHVTCGMWGILATPCPRLETSFACTVAEFKNMPRVWEKCARFRRRGNPDKSPKISEKHALGHCAEFVRHNFRTLFRGGASENVSPQALRIFRQDLNFLTRPSCTSKSTLNPRRVGFAKDPTKLNSEFPMLVMLETAFPQLLPDFSSPSESTSERHPSHIQATSEPHPNHIRATSGPRPEPLPKSWRKLGNKVSSSWSHENHTTNLFPAGDAPSCSVNTSGTNHATVNLPRTFLASNMWDTHTQPSIPQPTWQSGHRPTCIHTCGKRLSTPPPRSLPLQSKSLLTEFENLNLHAAISCSLETMPGKQSV